MSFIWHLSRQINENLFINAYAPKYFSKLQTLGIEQNGCKKGVILENNICNTSCQAEKIKTVYHCSSKCIFLKTGPTALPQTVTLNHKDLFIWGFHIGSLVKMEHAWFACKIGNVKAVMSRTWMQYTGTIFPIHFL